MTRAEGHGRNVGVKEVSAHTCNIAHVIAYVICDDCRVSRVILGDAKFDLTC